MKKLFLFSVAALAFCACSSDETVSENSAANQQPKEISFSPLAKPNTRGANAILDENFPHDNTMEVACYESAPNAGSYFSKTTFSFVDDDNDVWHDVSSPKYWPLSPATLNFFAVSGYDVNVNDIAINANLGTATVKYHSDAASNTSSTAYSNTTQSDIMYAFNRGAVIQTGNALSFNGGTTVGASKVDMVFKHALSQIDFQVKAADAATAGAITINSITLTGASYTGELTLTNDANVTLTTGAVTTTVAWTADASTDRAVPNVPNSLTYSAGDATDYKPAAPSNACLMIIPNATGAFTSFTINYRFNGNDYDYTYTPTSTAAVAGYKYTFQINFRLHEITINPSVTPWTDSNTPFDIQ